LETVEAICETFWKPDKINFFESNLIKNIYLKFTAFKREHFLCLEIVFFDYHTKMNIFHFYETFKCKIEEF